MASSERYVADLSHSSSLTPPRCRLRTIYPWKILTQSQPGNFYAIANPATDKPARIFFAQGCDVSELEPISESNQGGGGGGGGAEA